MTAFLLWTFGLLLGILLGVREVYILKRARNPLWFLIAAYLAISPGMEFLVCLVAVLTNAYGELNYYDPLDNWTLGLQIESVFLLALLAALALCRRVFRIPKQGSMVMLEISPTSLLLLQGVLLTILVTTMGELSFRGYETTNEIAEMNLDEASMGIGNAQSVVVQLFVLPAAIVLGLSSEKSLKWVRWPALGLVLVFVGRTMLTGGRGAFLNFGVAIACIWILNNKYKRVMLTGIILFLFLIIWSPAIVKFRTQHTREQARSLTEGDRARLLVQEIVNLENIANLDRNGLVSILSRVDQVQNAGVLAEYCSANQRFAGFSPYVGALLGFVPRLIFKDKPVPHSWNNTVAGTPWYVVGDIRNEPWNNFGLTTSGISYWQFGWWGVFGAAIANAFFMYTVLLRFVLGGIVMKALLLAYIYYSNSMFVLPPDLLAAFLTKILPYCLLLYAARHFKVFRPPLLSCGTQNKSA